MLDRLHDASGYGEHRTRARAQVGGLGGHGELDVDDRDEHAAGYGDRGSGVRRRARDQPYSDRIALLAG